MLNTYHLSARIILRACVRTSQRFLTGSIQPPLGRPSGRGGIKAGGEKYAKLLEKYNFIHKISSRFTYLGEVTRIV